MTPRQILNGILDRVVKNSTEISSNKRIGVFVHSMAAQSVSDVLC